MTKLKPGMRVFVKNAGAGYVESIKPNGVAVRLDINNGTNAVQTFRGSHVEKVNAK